MTHRPGKVAVLLLLIALVFYFRDSLASGIGLVLLCGVFEGVCYFLMSLGEKRKPVTRREDHPEW